MLVYAGKLICACVCMFVYERVRDRNTYFSCVCILGDFYKILPRRRVYMAVEFEKYSNKLFLFLR